MYEREHPTAFGTQHPWRNPLAAEDIFSPRPDQDFLIAGSLAPRPEDFPFSDDGRRDYYAAVSAAARKQELLQYMHMDQMWAAHQAAAANAAKAADHRTRQGGLLLLMR